MSNQQISSKTRLSIIAVALISFAGILSETSMNVTFPNLQEVFHLSLDSIQWVTTGYLLAVAIVMTTSSFLNGRVKERTLFLTALVFFTVGDLLGMLSLNFPMLLAARILQGIGTGIASPLMFNIILQRVPKQHVGAWMGFGGMILSIAPSIGPTYGGLLIGIVSWRMIFALILIVPLCSFIIGWRSIENSPKTAKQSFDFLAFILLALSFLSLLLTLNSLTSKQVQIGWLIIFVLAFAAFIVRSLKSKSDFLDIRVFKSLPFTLSVLAYAVYQFSNLGANFIIPNFLQVSMGLASFWAGLVLFPGTLLGAFATRAIGELYDKKGPAIGMLAGNTIFVLTLLVMSLFTKNLGLISMILLYICFTLGRCMAFSTTNTHALATMPKDKQAAGNAIFQTTQQFAGAAGTIIASLIATRASNLTQGTQRDFLAFLALAIINFAFFAIVLQKRKI